MVICFRIGGVEHCYTVPEYRIPLITFRPGPGPVNYPALIYDATVIASLHTAASEVVDDGVRTALQAGMITALEALKKRGGDHVSHVSFEGTARQRE